VTSSNNIEELTSKPILSTKRFSSFDELKRNGKRLHMETFSVSYLKLNGLAEFNENTISKVECGFIASKKGVHKRANKRNRAKRRLRGLCELFKDANHFSLQPETNWKLIFLANKITATAPATQLREDFFKMIQRISKC
jgi:ribonuclease P protein component